MTLEILTDQRAVHLDGQELTLGARAFDVLVYLSEHADRVVSKEELLDHVWSGKLVEESNLSVQIAGLRKALGAHAIKTVAGVGYRFVYAVKPAEAQGQTPKGIPLPDIPSVAVLPFANLTGSPDRAYLVDGIAQELIAALSRVRSFFVISSTSSFTYKGQTIDMPQVGRELGVRYVLEGSIQQAGEQLRIFTQLVEADTSHLIWQDRFDGRISEIFELQDMVAQKVSSAIEPTLIWAEAARVRAKPTESLAAYDLCLSAIPLVSRQSTRANLEQGLVLLERAMALDPSYTHAKALTCYAYSGAFANRWWTFEQAQGALGLAREVLEASIEDPLSLAYVGHHIAYIGKAHHEGLVALEKAHAINPNSATVSFLLAWVHIYLNNNDAAIEVFDRAKRLSPLHPEIGMATGGIANAFFQKEQIETAMGLYKESIAQLPEFASSHLGLMACYHCLGRTADSAHTAAWLRERVPDMTVSTFRTSGPQISVYYRNAVLEALQANGFPP